MFLYNWLLLFKHPRKDGEYGPFTDLSVNARLREHFITTWTLAATGRENYTDDAVVAYLLAKKFTGPWLRLITGPRSAGSTSTWWSGMRLLTLEKIIWCLSDICQTVTSCWINTCENFKKQYRKNLNGWIAGNRILVFAPRFLGSPGGKHCSSIERNVWRNVVSTLKKKRFWWEIIAFLPLNPKRSLHMCCYQTR